MQATAVTHGHDQIWLEDLKVHTAGAEDRLAVADMEGPMESLTAVIDELKSDPQAGDVLEHELRSLLKKLPHEIADDHETCQVHDPQWVADVIESASSEVLGRLQSH